MTKTPYFVRGEVLDDESCSSNMVSELCPNFKRKGAKPPRRQ